MILRIKVPLNPEARSLAKRIASDWANVGAKYRGRDMYIEYRGRRQDMPEALRDFLAGFWLDIQYNTIVYVTSRKDLMPFETDNY